MEKGSFITVVFASFKRKMREYISFTIKFFPKSVVIGCFVMFVGYPGIMAMTNKTVNEPQSLKSVEVSEEKEKEVVEELLKKQVIQEEELKIAESRMKKNAEPGALIRELSRFYPWITEDISKLLEVE